MQTFLRKITLERQPATSSRIVTTDACFLRCGCGVPSIILARSRQSPRSQQGRSLPARAIRRQKIKTLPPIREISSHWCAIHPSESGVEYRPRQTIDSFSWRHHWPVPPPFRSSLPEIRWSSCITQSHCAMKSSVPTLDFEQRTNLPPCHHV